jgi:hypothetical protein
MFMRTGLGNLRGPSHSSAVGLLTEGTVYPEGPMIHSLDRGILGFPSVSALKNAEMVPKFKFVTVCFSYSPPDLYS